MTRVCVDGGQGISGFSSHARTNVQASARTRARMTTHFRNCFFFVILRSVTSERVGEKHSFPSNPTSRINIERWGVTEARIDEEGRIDELRDATTGRELFLFFEIVRFGASICLDVHS